MSFDEVIARNKFKTNLVLLTYIIIFIFIGLLVDVVRINAQSLSSGFIDLISFNEFPLVTFMMLFIAVCVILFMINNFKKIMLTGSQYKLIDPSKVLSKKERDVYALLEELIRDSNTSFTPELYIMEAPYMNAFASGWNENNSIIALTTTLIENLREDELKAVIAHELSHIRHCDIRLTLSVGVLSNIMLLIANYSIFLFATNNKNNGANIAKIILLVLQFVLPVITVLLQMQLSRSREYMADSGAAYIMNDNKPMIRALQKISQSYTKTNYQHIDINPTRNEAYIFNPKEMFSTHPSIENRIKSLLGNWNA